MNHPSFFCRFFMTALVAISGEALWTCACPGPLPRTLRPKSQHKTLRSSLDRWVLKSTSPDFRFLSLFIHRAREGLASAHQANKLCYNNHKEVQMNFTGVITTCLRIAMFLMVLFITNTEPKCQSFLLTVSTAFHHDLSWSEINVAPKYLSEKLFLL